MKVKRSIAVVVLGICCWAVDVAQQPSAGVETKTAGETFDERLGEDDGAALAILIGANQRGNLEVCDCNQPRGGLARRVGYAEGFRRKFKDIPFLNVDAGFLFYGAAGYPKWVMIQNDQVLKAYSRWPLDVVNLGRFDLIYAQKLFEREGLAERASANPLIRNMISANGVFGPEVTPPPPFIVKEVTGPRIKVRGGKLRIAFLGLAEPVHVSEGLDATVTNLFDAARRFVPQAKKKADLVVILAHCEWNAAIRLANENPQADLVVAGNAEGFFEPEKVGDVLVIPASPGNVKEGDLRIYLDKSGRATFKYRLTDLDAVVPSDPAALAFTATARSERDRLR
jgi:2',3'-cyclic-nucleotide 2'-phosphodiesterase (5'-nucleotidase family)